MAGVVAGRIALALTGCGGTKDSPDAGLVIQAVPDDGATDAGSGTPATDAGTPENTPGSGSSAECEGLLPTPGPTLVAAGPGRWNEDCPGTTDGTGEYVALGYYMPRSGWFDVFPMGGGARVGGFWFTYIPEPYFVPVERGFHVSDTIQARAFMAVDPTGQILVREFFDGMVTIRPDPRGGSVVCAVPTGSTRTLVQWRDTDGRVTASVESGDGWGYSEIIGVTPSGDALVVARSNSNPSVTFLRWVGLSGPLSEPFVNPVPGAYPPIDAIPIVGGMLALVQDAFSSGAQVVGVIADGETTVRPAPAWLQARVANRTPGRAVPPWHLVRGGRAYAFLTATASDNPGGPVQLEVIAPSGTSCGIVELPFEGWTRNVNIGRDGTVIIGGEPLPYDPAHADRCLWRWWPALFR